MIKTVGTCTCLTLAALHFYMEIENFLHSYICMLMHVHVSTVVTDYSSLFTYIFVCFIKHINFFSSFLVWSDSAVPVERIIELKSFQVQLCVMFLCIKLLLLLMLSNGEWSLQLYIVIESELSIDSVNIVIHLFQFYLFFETKLI